MQENSLLYKTWMRCQLMMVMKAAPCSVLLTFRRRLLQTLVRRLRFLNDRKGLNIYIMIFFLSIIVRLLGGAGRRDYCHPSPV